MIRVEASAPSNIALIKYMGKTSRSDNRPTNSSFSWTLEGLRSFVVLEFDEAQREDQWEPLRRDGLAHLEMSEKGKQKFLNHLDRIRSLTGVRGFFRVQSGNSFPSDCGIASSASSFAALTRAMVEMAGKMNPQFHEPAVEVQADWSRQGSGSSCRSFFGPWVLWSAGGVNPVELPFSRLVHQVILVDGGRKTVSSSEAHQRCLTSLLFRGRPERAEERLEELLQALRRQEWDRAFQVTWSEFWDMHALFETSQPSFGYLRPGSLDILMRVRDFWKEKNDGPLATMDAGANVHLLWRPDQLLWAQDFAESIHGVATVLTDGVR